MNFGCIVIDPPWQFSDKLQMSEVKRGAEDHYNVLSIDELKKLKILELSDKDCVLCLWIVGSQVQEALDLIKSWGFKQKQTWCWIKTKQDPLTNLKKKISSKLNKTQSIKEIKTCINDEIDSFDINEILNFKIGHCFRQTHELCLIATRGKLNNILKNKSQRSVFLNSSLKHSEKPEGFQDKLDIMFPNENKLEIFARRSRDGWVCIGNESPDTLNEDIVDSIDNLINK